MAADSSPDDEFSTIVYILCGGIVLITIIFGIELLVNRQYGTLKVHSQCIQKVIMMILLSLLSLTLGAITYINRRTNIWHDCHHILIYSATIPWIVSFYFNQRLGVLKHANFMRSTLAGYDPHKQVGCIVNHICLWRLIIVSYSMFFYVPYQ